MLKTELCMVLYQPYRHIYLCSAPGCHLPLTRPRPSTCRRIQQTHTQQQQQQQQQLKPLTANHLPAQQVVQCMCVSLMLANAKQPLNAPRCTLAAHCASTACHPRSL
jgi:hypothetical protein